MVDFSTYKFRCSALGNLVSKSGKFTDGNKTYIHDTFIGEIYGVKRDVKSKYFEKGLFEEESGITILNNTLYKGKLLLKNKERKENEYIHGECDCIVDGIVYDIKNAWDLFTFGKAELTHNYYWQLVGYMWLWNVDKARLFYCLNNTPEHILLNEERKLFYAGNYISFEDKNFIAECEYLRSKHNYDNMHLYERFKISEINKLQDDIENLKSSIEIARMYMNELYENHLHNLEINKNFIK